MSDELLRAVETTNLLLTEVLRELRRGRTPEDVYPLPQTWFTRPAKVGTPTDKHLSVRGRKVVRRLGAETLEELETLTADDLLGIRGCGYTTLREIRDTLRVLGRSLRGE